MRSALPHSDYHWHGGSTTAVLRSLMLHERIRHTLPERSCHGVVL
jgi:hypothetical protein